MQYTFIVVSGDLALNKELMETAAMRQKLVSKQYNTFISDMIKTKIKVYI
jgi:hypothetical protein